VTARSTFSGRRRAAALAVATSALVATSGLSAGTAQSVPSSACPPSYPATDLVAGAPVTGLTVTSGTTPDEFGGTVVGVLDNGIGPGIGMVLVDLTSATIDRVGIWSGMSGSPVYAANGDLIGAVSYSLGFGPSTIAGVTPAADMQKLLSGGGPPLTAPPALRRTVGLSPSLRTSLVRAGAVSATAASQNMNRLQVPVTVSGLSSQRRASAAKVMHFGGSKMADAPAGPTSSEPIDIVAGGNLAAAMSFGAVTIAGVGTATAVCGNEVLGFGHPMNYTGPSTMTLHGARATHIQDDPTVSGFKSANIGAPIGTVDEDRLAGLHAVKGALPPGTPFTSVANAGAGDYTATSSGSVAGLTPDLGFANVVAAQDKVLDRVGKGSASATWTIQGTRKNGDPFTFTRKDVYADNQDISAATAFALAGDLQAIQDNPGETVKITSVRSSSRLYASDTSYVVQKVQARMRGAWVPLRANQPSPLRAGDMAQLKIFLTSRAGEPRTVLAKVYVPLRAANRVGLLEVTGGQEDAQSAGDFFLFGEEAFSEATPAPTSNTFPQVLKDLVAGPQHNQIQVDLRFRNAPAPANQAHQARVSINHVVLGALRLPIIARR